MDNSAWESGSFTGADGVELYLLDNPLLDDKQEAVKTGKAYRLLAVKGGNYEIVQVVFSGLPMISLTTDSGEEIRYDEIYGTMRFYAADTKENWVTESVMSAHMPGAQPAEPEEILQNDPVQTEPDRRGRFAEKQAVLPGNAD